MSQSCLTDISLLIPDYLVRLARLTLPGEMRKREDSADGEQGDPHMMIQEQDLIDMSCEAET